MLVWNAEFAIDGGEDTLHLSHGKHTAKETVSGVEGCLQVVITFQDKATENTMIYLTINEDSLIFERKGNTSMTMTLKENIESFGHYESSAGLFFDFSRCFLCRNTL